MAKRKEHKFINGVELKQCSRCQEWLPVSEFTTSPAKWDGLYCACRACTRERDRIAYTEGRRQKHHPYNPEYYSSEKSRQKKRERDARRRGLKRQANKEYVITDDIINKVRNKYDNKCAYCGTDCSDKFHIEHKIPLFRCGGNEIDNLALSCPLCNQRKGKKTDIEFVGHKV